MSRTLAALFLLIAVSVFAAGPSVHIEVHAKQPALMGQEVAIEVRITAPNYFLSAPVFPNIQIAGAVVTMPDESGLNSSEVVAGVTYASITKTYVFVAQQPGEFSLPPLRIEFKYANDDARPVTGSVTLPPSTISVKLPAGATSLAEAAPAARITIEQTLNRSVDGLKVGDALTRTIGVFAARTQAMMIPPTHFEAPDGVRVYVADPLLSDETREHVGFVGGHRTDRATYVFQKPGDYTLPAVDIDWTDPATQKRQTSRAPAIAVHIAASAAVQPAIAPDKPAAAVETERRPFAWRLWIGVGGFALLLVVVAWFVRRYLARFLAALTARRQRRRDSESRAFRQIEQACRRDDAAAAYRALLAWCVKAGWPSLASYGRTKQPQLATEIGRLEAHLYADTSASPWHGAGLLSALQDARRRERAGPSPTALLPPLNP